MERKMVNQPAAEDRLIDRRGVLRTGAALAAAGPALLHGAHAKAQSRTSGASPMTIIDAQVHAYAANTPERPWRSVPNWPPHVTGDEMVAAMHKVGVDGAIYISPFSMYQYDASYAVGVQRAHPDKFALVKPVNPDDPAVADVIADWKKTPGTVGIRIIMTKESKRAPDDPGFDRILRAAVTNDFPVNVLFWGNIDAGTALIDRHPTCGSSLIISESCSRTCHPHRRNPGPTSPRYWNSPSAKTQLLKSPAPARCPGSHTRSRTSGTPSLACSTPGVWTAACGAPTGRAHSLLSTTNRPSSPS
jgi:hypothetical protein